MILSPPASGRSRRRWARLSLLSPAAPTSMSISLHSPKPCWQSIRDHGGARLLTPTPSRASSIAAFSHPIQAWYATATREEHSGTLSFDDNDDNGWSGCVCDIGPPSSGPGVREREGDALRAGARSEMANVTVIADVGQTRDYRFSAVADYIAMLALTELKAADACQELPSVTNLIFPGCAVPDQASDADLAYLKGLYKVDPGEAWAASRTILPTQWKNCWRRFKAQTEPSLANPGDRAEGDRPYKEHPQWPHAEAMREKRETTPPRQNPQSGQGSGSRGHAIVP